MTKIYIIFFLNLFANYLFAQQHQIDSLYKAYHQYTYSDSNKVNLCNQLAYSYYRVNIDSTLFFAKEALFLAKKINYAKGIAESTLLHSTHQWVQGGYSQALSYINEALKLYEKIGDKKGISKCLNVMGVIYFRKQNYDEAIKYFRQGTEIDKKIIFFQGQMIKLSNMGWSYSRKGLYDSALFYLFKAVELNNRVRFREFMAVNLYRLGEAYYYKKDYINAEKYLKEALKEAKYWGSPIDQVFVLKILGNLRQQQQRFKEGEDYLLAALAINQQTKERDTQRDIYFDLYEYYKSIKKTEKSLYYFELFKQLQDSIFSYEKDAEFKSLEFTHQLQKKEYQIELLERDKKIKEDEATVQKVVSLSLIFGLLFITTLALSFFRGRQKQRQINVLLLQKNVEIQMQKEELLTQAEQLNEANHTKDKLFSIISHDLRSPLNTLKGMMVILSMEGLTTEDLQMIRKDVEKQLIGLETTLNNLLHWAKSQMEGENPHKESFNLVELIEEDIALLQATALNKNINLNNQVQQPTLIFADLNQIRTVLRNLIANAIKFTPDGGSVTIAAEQLLQSVQIKIIDTGVGMSEEQISKLFSMQTHFTTKGTSGEKGTGLGLLLCKDFVEKNDGKIWVTSKEGEGSIFYVELPNKNDR